MPREGHFRPPRTRPYFLFIGAQLAGRLLSLTRDISLMSSGAHARESTAAFAKPRAGFTGFTVGQQGGRLRAHAQRDSISKTAAG